MQLLNFPHDASLVTKSDHVLYDNVSATTLTLTGDLPSVAFRCRVTISSVTDHIDVAGSVTVGTEILTFMAAGTKTTTTSLSALPTITTSNLDCNILIIAVGVNGQPIQDETLTTLKIRFEPTSKMYQNVAGTWTQSTAYCMVVSSTPGINSVIRYNSTDYTTRQVEAFSWLDGTEVYRILYF